MYLSIFSDTRYHLSDKLFAYGLSIIVFILSLYFAPYYSAGDQISYTNYYNSVVGKSIFGAYLLQIKLLSSYEPLYALFVWVFSRVIEKDTFDSLMNLFLCYSAVKLFLHLGANRFFIFLFVLANFYMLVLYFAADRLKLSFLFFFLGFDAFYTKKEIRSVPLFLLSILSHLQILLFLFSVVSILLMENGLKIFTRLVINLKELLLIISISVFVLVILIFFYEHIINKLEFYLSDSITEIFKPSVFLILSLFSSTNKRYVVASFIPLLIAAFIVSGDRIVMMAFLLFLYYSVGERGISRGMVWITALYFTYKSYFFVQSIVLHGNGFY